MTDEEIRDNPELRKTIAQIQKDHWSNETVKKAIVKLLVNHVEKNGSCRAGWASEFIIGAKQQNHVHDKVAGLVTRSGEYIKERNEKFKEDWTIYRNPNYEFVEISKRTSIIQRRALYITIGLSVITLIISWLNYSLTRSNQLKQKELQEQIYNLTPPSIRIDTVIVNQQRDST